MTSVDVNILYFFEKLLYTNVSNLFSEYVWFLIQSTKTLLLASTGLPVLSTSLTPPVDFNASARLVTMEANVKSSVREHVWIIGLTKSNRYPESTPL